MTSFFDTWSVVWDDNNKPLLGKIEFCEANTTTLKEIYDDTGNPTDNPIYVNGRTTNQVLLGAGDYTVRYWRYIGHGNMESDNNESSWFNYKTELVKGSVAGNGESLVGNTIKTIAELKNIVPQDGMVVTVLGYYNESDCPARMYVWHANARVNDDGGYKIKSNTTTTGAWILKVPGSYIDVRWFGDIPDTKANPTTQEQTSNLGQRAAAADCANNLSKDLYFPKGWYMFDGTNTVSVTKDIICDNKVYFVVKENTVGTKVQCHELHKCDKNLFIGQSATQQPGQYTLVADWIKASWFSISTYNATGARIGYIIDGNDTSRTAKLKFANARVEVTGTNTYDIDFENCEITDSPHLLSKNISMKNMYIKQEWFTKDYNFSNLSVYTGCDTKLVYCDDADSYIMLKNKCLKYDYGDCGEQTIHNAKLGANCILSNCTGTAEVSGATELHNTSLTLTVNAQTEINAVDCWLTINAPQNVMGHTSIRRGMLANAGTNAIQILSGAHLSEVAISAAIKLYGHTQDNILRCDIYNSIDYIGNNGLTIDSCTFFGGGGLTYAANEVEAYGIFNNNIFKSGSTGLSYSAQKTNSKLNMTWTNNHSDMATQFITIDRTNLYVADSGHKYSYANNTGANTLKPSSCKTFQDGTNNKWCNSSVYWSTTDTAIALKRTSKLWLIQSTTMIPTIQRCFWEGVWVRDASIFADLTPMLFSVGNAYVDVNISVTYMGSSSHDGSKGTSSTQTYSWVGRLILSSSTGVVDFSPLEAEWINGLGATVCGHDQTSSSITNGVIGQTMMVTVDAKVRDTSL